MCLGQYDVLHLDAFWGNTLQSQWLVLDEAHAEALRGNFLTEMGHWQVGSLSPILLFALYTLVLLQLWAKLPKSWKQIGKRITWATLLIWGAMSLGITARRSGLPYCPSLRETASVSGSPADGTTILSMVDHATGFPGSHSLSWISRVFGPSAHGGSVMRTVNMQGGVPMHWKGSNLIKSSDRLPENQPLHGGPSREPWNKRRFLWLR